MFNISIERFRPLRDVKLLTYVSVVTLIFFFVYEIDLLYFIIESSSKFHISIYKKIFLKITNFFAFEVLEMMTTKMSTKYSLFIFISVMILNFFRFWIMSDCSYWFILSANNKYPSLTKNFSINQCLLTKKKI